MKVSRYAWMILAFLAQLTVPEQEKSWKIMAVGDSITQGGKTTQPEYTYRLPLQMMLTKGNIPFDFIGSRQAGLHQEAEWPDVADNTPFDPDHEGYYGKKTAYVVSEVISNWEVHGEIPDLVLVHLGTNDQKSESIHEDIYLPLRRFILFLRENNPRVIVLLGHLNFSGGDRIEAIRSTVESLAGEMNTVESPVRTVHHYPGWTADPDQVYTDTFDWAHPNLKGQEKMARTWFEVMKEYLIEK